MTRGDLKTEILVRSGKDTTSAWTSEAFLNDWINQAHRWAAGYKPWPFTEGRQSTTYTTTEEWNFEGYKTDSIKLLEIGGERFEKLTFEDYKRYKEDQSSGTEKFYTDYANTLYVNTLSGASGTMTIWGQYIPAVIPDGDGLTADDIETVFVGSDEGNEAIIEKVLGNLYNRDDKPAAIQHYQLAQKQLDDLWQRMTDSQFNYQTKDRGMFKGFDVLCGDYDDSLFNENRF